jgi:membrane fusion protein, heavy metal efflux system
MNSTPDAYSTVATVPPEPHEKPSALGRILSAAQFLLALGLTCGVLGWLLFVPATEFVEKKDERQPPYEVVTVAGDRLVSIRPGSTIAKTLEQHCAAIDVCKVATPKVTVTGRVVASLRPAGDGKTSDYWQFDSAENLTAYTDWQKAIADIAFSDEQLKSITKLADARVEAQQKVVARLEKTVTDGSEARKDLDAEKANLVQLQIQGRKDKHEAETALRLAQRAEAATARQLQQGGLEPDLLKATSKDVDIVMAEVPEARIDDVKVGQKVTATFVSLGSKPYFGAIDRIAPTLSKDRHSLRVLCKVKDPVDELRPGMFADIGLGTDERDTILVPAEAVLHIKRWDFVLVAQDEKAGLWRVVRVKIGDLHTDKGEERLEVMSGLKAGDRVLTKGSILIKPVIMQALAVDPSWMTSPNEGRP